MKVLHQLIKHFWQRGVLTKEQADYLVEHGFIRPRDLDFYEPVPPPPEAEERSFADRPFPSIDAAPDGLEQQQDKLSAPAPTKRKGRSAAPRLPDYSTTRLGGDLQKILRECEALLPALVRLAGTPSIAKSVDEAVAMMRGLSQSAFRQLVVKELRVKPGLLAKWWEFLDPEPFHSLVNRPRVRGPVVRDFELILTATEPGAWGRARWLLKLPEVQAVVNLLAVRQQLLGAVRWLYDKHLSTLNHCMRRPARPARSWTALGYGLVLVYNARAWRAKRKPSGYVLDRTPPPGGWREAWTTALSFHPEPVMPYCVHIFGGYPDRGINEDRNFAALDHQMICPNEWKV